MATPEKTADKNPTTIGWDSHKVSDIKRPISKRGFDDAVLMVQILNNLLISI